ncbi:MAG: LysM peptidoglycan-binding domain-containing protein [Bdellovibrionaceae bacterium]|nr:LysM peptidoglycan-binding domain-containing protein [Pseudobdellovibrionaceae bacterium]
MNKHIATVLVFGGLLAIGLAFQNFTTYRVRQGDTLSSIAKRFGTTEAALIKASNLQNPMKLEVGQKLTIASKPLVIPDKKKGKDDKGGKDTRGRP